MEKIKWTGDNSYNLVCCCPLYKTLPQFEQNGLTFPMQFAESEPEYKPMGTSEVQIANFKADNLITKICHWLQTIK